MSRQLSRPWLLPGFEVFELNPGTAVLVTNERRVSEQNGNGNTVLHLDFLMHTPDLVLDLLMDKYLQETTRNLSNGDGLSILHIACTRPYIHLVQKLLTDEHVNVDCKVNQGSTSIYAGYTPLHFAVKFDQREVAELLLARFDANLYQQDAKGSTPIHLALERVNLAMLDLLLTHDRRRENIVNGRGLSHFMAACAGSDELTVVEYLRAAPDWQLINATVNYVAGYRFAGYTPLRFAVEFERANTAQLLKIRGARQSENRDSSLARKRWMIYCCVLACIIVTRFLPPPFPEVFNFFSALFLFIFLGIIVIWLGILSVVAVDFFADEVDIERGQAISTPV